MTSETLNDNQKKIIKDYIEGNYLDASPDVRIDFNQVLDDILSSENFFDNDGDRDRFLSSDLYLRYCEYGNRGMLQNYEGYADFFESHGGVSLSGKDYSSEMGDLPDDFEEKAESAYASLSSGETGKKASSGEKSSGSSENNHSKSRAREAMRPKKDPASDGQGPIDPGRSDRSYRGDPRDIQDARKYRSVMSALGSLESWATVPGALVGAAGNKISGYAGSFFGSSVSHFQKKRRMSEDLKAEKEGYLESPEVAGRVLRKKMADIQKRENRLSSIQKDLEKSPSNIDLRAQYLKEASMLSGNITKTGKMLEENSHIPKDLRKKFTAKITESSKALSDRIENQKIIDFEKFKHFQEQMKKMLETVRRAFKMNKDANDPKPS